MKMFITKHAKIRLRERCGVTGKNAKSLVARALRYGTQHCHMPTELRRVANRIVLKNKKINNIRVYSGYVFLFDGKHLITVYDISKKYNNQL